MNAQQQGLAIWVVYDHPRDFPEVFIARKHISTPAGSVATDETLVDGNLEVLRDQLDAMGLYRLCISTQERCREASRGHSSKS